MALLLAACVRAAPLRRGSHCARRATPAARASCARAPQPRVARLSVACRALPAAQPHAAAPAPPAVSLPSGDADDDDTSSSGGFSLALMSAALALSAGPASAAYTAAVDTQEVTSVAQNVIGVLFTIAFAAFLLRVLNKRASRAVNVRVAAQRKAVDAPAADLPPVTAAACFQGAGLAVLCAAAMWFFTTFVEGAFDSAAPSDQYAVRNVTGTLRSIVTGLGYLATFLFAANTIGLSGLGLQILVGGGQQDAAKQDTAPPPPGDKGSS
jgi:hypothetical protein